MELNLNIPDWLKIPLKILLPATWLFSGSLLLLPVEWLQKLYLLEWAQKNGFIFCLLFAITSCLLLMYIMFYAKNGVSAKLHKLTFKRNTLRNIMASGDIEQCVIYKLYNSPSYTLKLNYNQPVMQGLLSRGYVYIGHQQAVTLDPFNNSIPALFTLQPFVYQALDYYQPKLEKKINRLIQKSKKVKSTCKKDAIIEQLQKEKEYYELVYNGGINNE